MYLANDTANSTRDALNLTQEEVDYALGDNAFTTFNNWEDVIRCIKFENGTTYLNWTFTDATWLEALEIQ